MYLLILFAALANISYGQLGEPKTTVKDTFAILTVSYNGTSLDKQDWPAKQIIEDPVNIYIANYKYTKNKPTFSEIKHYDSTWEGHVDVYAYDNAKCNGKTQKILIVRPHEDCELNYVCKYVIGDYEFMVLSSISRWLDSMGKQ